MSRIAKIGVLLGFASMGLGCGSPIMALGSDAQNAFHSFSDAASELERFSKVVRTEYHRSENRIHRLADNIEESTASLNLVALRLEEASRKAGEACDAARDVGKSIKPAIDTVKQLAGSYCLDQVLDRLKSGAGNPLAVGGFITILGGLAFLWLMLARHSIKTLKSMQQGKP